MFLLIKWQDPYKEGPCSWPLYAQQAHDKLINYSFPLWYSIKVHSSSQFPFLRDTVFVVQLWSCVWVFVTAWTAACQASLSLIISRVHSNSCPLSWWYHPTISFSVTFFFHLQSFPALEFFPWVGSSLQVAKLLKEVLLVRKTGPTVERTVPLPSNAPTKLNK